LRLGLVELWHAPARFAVLGLVIGLLVALMT